METDPFSSPPPAATPLIVPATRRLVIWDESGNPVVTTAPLITHAQVRDLYAGAAAETFICEDPFSPDHQYNGLSMAEVMVKKQVRQAALTGLAEAVIDRLIGRPKQTTETTKLVLTYEDKLKEIARQESLKSSPIVEATVTRTVDEDEGVLEE